MRLPEASACALDDLPSLCKDNILNHLKVDAIGTLWHTALTNEDRTLHVDASEMLSNYESVMEEIDRLNHGVCGLPMMKRIALYCTSYAFTYWDANDGCKRHHYDCSTLDTSPHIDAYANKIVMFYHGEWFT
jgi:hypothetical protein